ncbi:MULTISPECIES: hypothetical protein [Streptomyces]|uniref:DNA primase/polymerase bifunctional N-terminal domain-containing protein n=2 Tax=Streptomyces diastaticus group TaxID=2849069 RepID=A0A8H9LKK1_9ACTN|nr:MULTISPECIES: hypothetical protein [Streptomyces]WSU35869.1 hypothetical protein OG378_08695 [Streptomyces gougerotii]GFH63633.1 hypothetical protein Srut_01470 [Streptomyces rutgersensis]GFH74797.1 hypothetical protein Sdia_55650 [Streptomyces diastaticus subsp. diastaticus]GFH77106.1 hypothetical protein Sgou_17760 [Streptomyces gougerotii]GGU05438.1 hypothetical protein GCM10015534_04340 [Streptomyces diastaticus subsp. diastaticus]
MSSPHVTATATATARHRSLAPGARSSSGPLDGQDQSARVTAEGAAWLASAGAYPGVAGSAVLRCGLTFDVVNVPPVFGHRMLDRLWEEGPGSGPAAVQRGRLLLFAAPGTAQRLPALLRWEECGSAVPPLLCHGVGDAVTVPGPDTVEDAGAPVPALRAADLHPRDGEREREHTSGPGGAREAPPEPRGAGAGDRWLVAPGARYPWLPGADVLRWACVRAARSTRPVSIFPPVRPGAKVYDVSRRR